MLPKPSKLSDMPRLLLKSIIAVESESTDVAERAGEKGFGELFKEVGDAWLPSGV